MHQIVRNLLALVLIADMMQSGMAQWTPHFGADMTRDEGMSSSHSSPKRESCTHGGLPDANAEAASEDVHGGGCDRPNIGCDCSGCLNYFDAHSLTLPAIAAVPPQDPESEAYESGMIALFVGLNFAPPTPFPRSQYSAPRSFRLAGPIFITT